MQQTSGFPGVFRNRGDAWARALFIGLTCNHTVTYNSTMDNVFKALADTSRRLLLDQLYLKNGQTLNELCAHLSMSRQAVTSI